MTEPNEQEEKYNTSTKEKRRAGKSIHGKILKSLIVHEELFAMDLRVARTENVVNAVMLARVSVQKTVLNSVSSCKY
jgi:hypothetical protein